MSSIGRHTGDPVSTVDSSDAISALHLELINFSRALHLLRTSGPLTGRAQPAGIPVLAKLRHHGPMRSSAIAEVTGLDPSTVSRQVDGLCKSGLVRRIADPDDGRATLLTVTQEGHAELVEYGAHISALLGQILTDWTPDQVETLAVSLRRLNEDAAARLPNLLERPRQVTS